MASIDSLPPDQRAVLELVLRRGRSYDQIAEMLRIDRAGVRARALAAFDALGPRTRVSDEERALIADYLLGALPPRVSERVQEHLAESAAQRAWARVIASELEPIAAEALPEIPTEVSMLAERLEAGPAAEPVAPEAEPELEPEPELGPEPEPEPEFGREPARAPVAGVAGPVGVGAQPGGSALREPVAARPRPRERRRSSRAGGAFLLSLGALVVVAVVVTLLVTGGSSKRTSPSARRSSTTATTATTTTSAGATPVPLAQINLNPPSGGKAKGVAEVLRENGRLGIAIVADGLAPNTKNPPDAYAVWLYNSASDARILGFVNPGVGTNGRMQTAGGLPSGASRYREVLVTLEHRSNPRTPGTIILEGRLTGIPSS